MTTVEAGEGSSKRQKLHAAVWRWHFYAGIFVAPFLVMLPLTGLVMLAAGPLERWQLGPMLRNTPGDGAATHQARLDAARAAIRGGIAVRYLPGRTSAEATRVTVTVAGEPYSVFVDAGTARVRGVVQDSRLLHEVAHRIHGTLLMGDWGDRVVEVAASLGILLIVSGIYLWLPRSGGFRRAWRIGRETPRIAWRDLHKATGAALAPMLGFYLVSGLAWTGVWGEKFVQAWSTLSAAQATPRGSASRTHGALDAGTTRVVPWNLEQAPMPTSAANGRVLGEGVTLDDAVAVARREGIGARFWVGLPDDERGVYTIAQTALNGDVTDPTRELLVHVDRYSGAVVGRTGWNDYDRVARAMAAGIPLHMGSLGGWNLVGAAAVCLATAMLGISGLVTWWLRRPARAFRLAAPPLPARVDVPLATWATAAILGILFPLAGATLVAVALLDWAVVSRVSVLKRALS
jgi:uncharacterized iron-regulated membrane protein